MNVSVIAGIYESLLERQWSMVIRAPVGALRGKILSNIVQNMESVVQESIVRGVI